MVRHLPVALLVLAAVGARCGLAACVEVADAACRAALGGGGAPLTSDAVNQTAAAGLAAAQAGNDSLCPAWRWERYACSKYFPRCTEAADGTDVVVRLCRTSCSNDRTCRNFNQDECDGAEYSDDSDCFSVRRSDEESRVWQYALAGVVGFGALVLLGSYAWSRYKECSYDPERDPHIDEVVEADAIKARAAEAAAASTAEGGYVDLQAAPAPRTGSAADVTIEDRKRAWDLSQQKQREAEAAAEAAEREDGNFPGVVPVSRD